MMCALWFVRCSDDEYAAVRAEIRRRDGAVRIVRAADSALAARVLDGREKHACAAMVVVDGSDCDALGWIDALSARDEVVDVVALVPDGNADAIASTLDAGATEVIPVSVGWEVSDDLIGLPVPGALDCKPACDADDDSSGEPCGTTGMTAKTHAGSGRGATRNDADEVRGRGRADLAPIEGEGLEDDPFAERDEFEAAYMAGRLELDLEEPDGGECAQAEDTRTCAPAPLPLETAVKRVRTNASAASDVSGPRAPLVAGISGRGGVGKSSVLAAMAAASARFGLRTAVLDLDLMFGNTALLLGADDAGDLLSLVDASRSGRLAEEDILRCAVRTQPGVTVWGPITVPERAELMARPVEMLIEVLRREADVIFVDTSVFWGDAMAAAIAQSERCLVFGDGRPGGGDFAARAIDLAARIGVPRTRMTSVFNRADAKGNDEDAAMSFELACSLSSRIRIANDDEVGRMLEYGCCDGLVARPGSFSDSVRTATRELLAELGCSVGEWTGASDADVHEERMRFRLPWKKG